MVLVFVVFEVYISMIELLIEYGVDINVVDEDGDIFLYLVVIY